MKPIVKEILIIVLSFIITILALGILLYDYIPLNQAIPEISEYKKTEEIEEQLKEIATSDNSEVVLTYEISETDLGVYENTKNYDKGKANPFSSYAQQETQSNVTTNNANGSTVSEQTNSETTSQNTTDNSQSSQNANTFYEDTQTK